MSYRCNIQRFMLYTSVMARGKNRYRDQAIPHRVSPQPGRPISADEKVVQSILKEFNSLDDIEQERQANKVLNQLIRLYGMAVSRRILNHFMRGVRKC